MISHQTLRLSRGRHASPDDGTCVAELVSLLAGEQYSDRPHCACPALTAFLRGYNDAVDDVRRQDLFAVASDLVGTRGPEDVTTRRGEALVALAWRYERRIGLVKAGPILNFPRRVDRYEGAGAHLGLCARTQPGCHEAVLATVAAFAAEPVRPPRPRSARLTTREVLERIVGGDRLPGRGVVDEGAPRRADARIAVER